ncbi:Intercellular signal essential for a variety of patterning events during development (By similarity) [Seminavis robusta]|uniref:Intercellular signal essential for a variety of patterning events during development By similarity n=1 Tax=Seminavis robusta TaxID=568900 RepID=A0A9N8DEZ3_9STRA|nr:Intercellular signal essential for a variety of patterning events during development (By similarity) [Seminavis robusta]|eukprot:Sro39_g023990.1 Intercellular signal essential for a variety of patterning events during development (By similarity) (1177) ;mRNA; r:25687-29467
MNETGSSEQNGGAANSSRRGGLRNRGISSRKTGLSVSFHTQEAERTLASAQIEYASVESVFHEEVESTAREDDLGDPEDGNNEGDDASHEDLEAGKKGEPDDLDNEEEEDDDDDDDDVDSFEEESFSMDSEEMREAAVRAGFWGVIAGWIQNDLLQRLFNCLESILKCLKCARGGGGEEGGDAQDDLVNLVTDAVDLDDVMLANQLPAGSGHGLATSGNGATSSATTNVAANTALTSSTTTTAQQTTTIVGMQMATSAAQGAAGATGAATASAATTAATATATGIVGTVSGAVASAGLATQVGVVVSVAAVTAVSTGVAVTTTISNDQPVQTAVPRPEILLPNCTGDSRSLRKTGFVELHIQGLPIEDDIVLPEIRQELELLFQSIYNNLTGMCLDPFDRVLWNATLERWETFVAFEDIESMNTGSSNSSISTDQVRPQATTITYWTAEVSCNGCPDSEPLFDNTRLDATGRSRHRGLNEKITNSSSTASNGTHSPSPKVGVDLSYEEFFPIFASNFGFHLPPIVVSVVSGLNITNSSIDFLDLIQVVQALTKSPVQAANSTSGQFVTVKSLKEDDIQEYDEFVQASGGQVTTPFVVEELSLIEDCVTTERMESSEDDICDRLGSIDAQEIVDCLNPGTSSSARCSVLLEGLISSFKDQLQDQTVVPTVAPALIDETLPLDDVQEIVADTATLSPNPTFDPSPQTVLAIPTMSETTLSATSSTMVPSMGPTAPATNSPSLGSAGIKIPTNIPGFIDDEAGALPTPNKVPSATDNPTAGTTTGEPTEVSSIAMKLSSGPMIMPTNYPLAQPQFQPMSTPTNKGPITDDLAPQMATSTPKAPTASSSNTPTASSPTQAPSLRATIPPSVLSQISVAPSHHASLSPATTSMLFAFTQQEGSLGSPKVATGFPSKSPATATPTIRVTLSELSASRLNAFTAKTAEPAPVTTPRTEPPVVSTSTTSTATVTIEVTPSPSKQTPSPTFEPTPDPTPDPTPTPTAEPTPGPTFEPTPDPTADPTAPPTQPPTEPPTNPPTNPPSVPPTEPPTEPPSSPPTTTPTLAPTEAPTLPPADPPSERPIISPTTPQPTTEECNAAFAFYNETYYLIFQGDPSVLGDNQVTSAFEAAYINLGPAVCDPQILDVDVEGRYTRRHLQQLNPQHTPNSQPNCYAHKGANQDS